MQYEISTCMHTHDDINTCIYMISWATLFKVFFRENRPGRNPVVSRTWPWSKGHDILGNKLVGRLSVKMFSWSHLSAWNKERKRAGKKKRPHLRSCTHDMSGSIPETQPDECRTGAAEPSSLQTLYDNRCTTKCFMRKHLVGSILWHEKCIIGSCNLHRQWITYKLWFIAKPSSCRPQQLWRCSDSSGASLTNLWGSPALDPVLKSASALLQAAC